MKTLKQINKLGIDITEYIQWQNTNVEIVLHDWDKDLTKLNETDFLPRYNKITIEIKLKNYTCSSYILLNVKRLGSKLEQKNFYTVPVYVPELKNNLSGKYSFLSFDSFNVPFSSMIVDSPTLEVYSERQINDNYLGRSEIYSNYLE